MSDEMVKDVCQQITHLSQLQRVCLSLNNLASIDLNLSNTTKLKWLDLSDTRMSREQCIDVFRQLNNLPFLNHFDLSNNNLTGCLSTFLADPHPGLPELEWFYLECTSLYAEDLLHLSDITKLNKLPKLLKLDLSHNTLTGYLSNLLPDSHPGIRKLRYLDLDSTKLNKEDLRHLSNIAEKNKLPKLESLNLSENTLTGCLSSFLADPHRGVPKLRMLYPRHTGLNKGDSQHLANIMKTRKFPRLESIDLDRALHNMQNGLGQLTNFLETCVNFHKTGLTISLKKNNLPSQFREENG